jgi:UDP-hydrolysing UDP-N-acetyl-D-glucosamine 2-epimerase
MRKLCVFTGTRAEYGLLRSVMRGIKHCPDAILQTVVSGTHLHSEYGNTVDEMLVDGLVTDERPNILVTGGTANAVATAVGIGMIRFADTLDRLKPDMIVLLGDRFETFAMAAAAVINQIPIAHIYGGEATEGVIDEAFRHSITKMSHLHFTACEAYRRRVIQLGEKPENVYNVGSLGVEALRGTPPLSEEAIRTELGLDAGQPYFLCTLHPVTLERAGETMHVAELCQALDTFADHALVFTGANADPGGNAINRFLQDRSTVDPRYRFFMSLGQKRYFSAAKYAACVVGNSSSGIVEMPSLGTPVVDIGDRQKGRIRHAMVMHACAREQDITLAIRKVLTEEYKREYSKLLNPYEREGTAAAIVRHLITQSLDTILKKHFYDCACGHGMETPPAQTR